MKQATGNWVDNLRRSLSGAGRIAVIGIGDELSPVDWPGMFVAREIDTLGLPGLRVFLAGTVPETMTGPVRIYKPDHILFLDAAEMGADPGTAAVIHPETISAMTFSTHALPLSVVMDYLQNETGAEITLIGIQPDKAWLHNGASARDRKMLSTLVRDLAGVLQKALKPGTA